MYSILRQKKVIKKKINASYNRDSSKEYDDLPDYFSRKRRGRVPAANKNKLESRPERKTRKRKKAALVVVGDAVISTPVGSKKAKQKQNLSFNNVSPIGHGHPLINFADITYSPSQLAFPPKTKPVERKFFNRRVEINLDHDSVKELMRSFVNVVNASSVARTGQSIIEISHSEEEIVDQVLERTNPETLIGLALLPRNTLNDVLQQSMRSSLDKTNSLRESGSQNVPTSDEVLTRNVRTDSPDFYGFNDSSVVNAEANSPKIQFVTHRKTKSSDKSSKQSSVPDQMSRNTSSSPDFLGFTNTTFRGFETMTSQRLSPDDVRDIIAGERGPPENLLQDRISLNYFNKTVEESINESIPANLEPIYVADSTRCSRNDVTRADAPECNKLSNKSLVSPSLILSDKVSLETYDISDVSVIPATPIQHVTRRKTRATNSAPTDNLSVIDCTFTERASHDVTRRMTKKNVQFTEMEQPQTREPRERKTVAFEVTSHDESSAATIHLAPGKWRKSLAAWKRKTLAFSSTNNETDKSEVSTKKISGVRKSDGRWLSSVQGLTIQEDDGTDDEGNVYFNSIFENVSHRSSAHCTISSDSRHQFRPILSKTSQKLGLGGRN